MARYPAIVKEYYPDSHSARVDILGFTSGDSNYPMAEIEYSIGDKWNHTEIKIKSGDYVWVDFINNDIRYPIITGYRNPQVGCSSGWRRFEHDNFEFKADDTIVLSGKRLQLQFEEIDAVGITTFQNEVTTASMLHAAAGVDNGGGGAVSVQGGMNITGGDVTTDSDMVASGVSLIEHTHDGDSGGTTSKAKS